MRVELGQVLANRYAVGQPVRAGGSGALFRAQDLRSGRAVAVKVVEVDDALDAARFAREAAALAGLDHPGIVKYVDHGALAGQAAYLVMEWVDGDSVAARMAGAGMTAREAALAGAAAAESLAHAHRHGLVHRDVKPDNMMLAGGGIVLVDFGLARAVGADLSLTRTGTIVGTPGYLAPEQARGERHIDARADAFALGCTIYQCLSGRRAFGGTSLPALLVKSLLAEPEPLDRVAPHVPRAIAQLIEALLAKDPAGRPADLDAVAGELRRHAPADGGPVARMTPGGAATVRGPRVVALCAPQPGEGAPALDRARGAVDSGGDGVDLAVAQLRDGALVVTSAAGSRPVEAAQIARAALALHAAFPRALVALAAGGDPVDVAARLIQAAGLDAAVGPDDRVPPVEIDGAAAELLRGAYRVVEDGGRFELAGARATP
jgi:hypothetical protein